MTLWNQAFTVEELADLDLSCCCWYPNLWNVLDAMLDILRQTNWPEEPESVPQMDTGKIRWHKRVRVDTISRYSDVHLMYMSSWCLQKCTR